MFKSCECIKIVRIITFRFMSDFVRSSDIYRVWLCFSEYQKFRVRSSETERSTRDPLDFQTMVHTSLRGNRTIGATPAYSEQTQQTNRTTPSKWRIDPSESRTTPPGEANRSIREGIRHYSDCSMFSDIVVLYGFQTFRCSWIYVVKYTKYWELHYSGFRHAN